MKKYFWLIILLILVAASVFSYFFIVKPACDGLEGDAYQRCMEDFTHYDD